LLTSGAAFSAGNISWGYSGNTGPDHWAELSPEFVACAGKNQSSVNLTGVVDADLKPIDFSYVSAPAEVVNNGHTVQVNTPARSKIVVDGTVFELKQFHFHAPGENRIKGQSYPLEAHLVHADKGGNLAVVAVMIEGGKANEVLAQAWAKMPQKAGAKTRVEAAISPEALLPANRDYYRFNGSLTVPPCTEGVRWLVMKEVVPASNEQIEAFTKVMGHANNRPLQPINARVVLD